MSDKKKDITGPMAVALDELLSRFTPAMAQELAALFPPQQLDQLDAAVADSQQILRALHTEAGDRTLEVPHERMNDWLRLGMLHTLTRWAVGEVRTCMHAPDMAHPQPVFAAAWSPGLLVCAWCTHLLQVSGVADYTCDGCGHVCKGTQASDGISVVTAVLGALSYQAGVCRDCCAALPTNDAEL